MKVLIIRCYPSIVNINQYNLQEIGLAKALIRKGNTCDIVYYSGRSNNKEEFIEVSNTNKKIKIYWRKGINLLGNVYYKGLIKEKFIKEYDIIQLSEYNQIYTYYFNKRVDKPCIIYHGPYDCEFNKNFSKRCKIFDKIYLKKYLDSDPYFITKSELASNFLIRKGFENVKTIGVGLDEDRFKEFGEKVKHKEKLLLYIGSIDERRNILFLLRVFKLVLNKNKDTKLILIGKSTKKYLDKVNKYINENNLQNNIIYKETVNQSDIYKFYRQADLFLLPTNYEIFGMVMLEAMFFEVPVITGYNGGSSVLIKNGYNGFMIEKFDEEKWMDKIDDILNNTAQIDLIAKKARQTILNEFTWDKIAEKFLENYKSVINKKDNKER